MISRTALKAVNPKMKGWWHFALLFFSFFFLSSFSDGAERIRARKFGKVAWSSRRLLKYNPTMDRLRRTFTYFTLVIVSPPLSQLCTVMEIWTESIWSGSQYNGNEMTV